MMNNNTVLALRMPTETRKKLNLLAEATGRTLSFLALEAISSYVEMQSWQVEETKKALNEADEGDFATPAQMKKFLAKWKVNGR